MRRHNPTNTSRLAENAHARTGTVNIYYLCSVRVCELLDASKWPRISRNNKKPQFFKLIKRAPFSIPSFRALSRWWWLCRRCCSCSGLRTLRFCWAVLPPHPRVTLIFLPPPHSLLSVSFSLALSLSLMLCFVCEDYVGKTSRQVEALRLQSHLCGGWEVKQCGRWRLGSGQSGEAGRRLVKMLKQVKDVSSCFQDPPWRLLGPTELPMWPTSISFLQPVGLAG